MVLLASTESSEELPKEAITEVLVSLNWQPACAVGRRNWTITMDRDTKATLYRNNMRAESDKMTTIGRIEDLVRQFMILPKETRREYSIAVGEREYGFREIEDLAREFGIEEN